jgi:stage II sporulation protein D
VRQLLKKTFFFILFLFLFVYGSKSLFASQTQNQTHNTEFLRIGLEQFYREQTQINILSRHLEIGVFTMGFFHPLGYLTTETSFTAAPTNASFARLPYFFATLADAQQFAVLYEASVPAIMADGSWGLYIEETGLTATIETAETIPSRTSRVTLSTNGRVVLISENEAINLQVRDISGITNLGTRQYRGYIELARFRGQNLTAVNIIHMSEYLHSVVPSEMPASWHMEAIKAQAVAARTFTLYRAGRVGQHYDLCDTTFSQVYTGVAREHPNSTQAVNETAGLIMLHEGRPIFAAYSACAGGHTANSEDVWVAALPYLRATPELYHGNNLPWQRSFTLSEINSLLTAANINIGQAEFIEIITSGYGLVMELKIHGTTGIHTVQKESTRTFFNASSGGGLRSRMYTIVGGTVTSLNPSQTNPNPNPNPPLQAPKETFNEETFIMGANGNIITANSLKGLYSIDFTGIISPINIETDNIYETPPEEPGSVRQAVSVRSSGYNITLEGRGWGHGVGMSQHGAHAMAQMGHDFTEILLWYYTGVEITQT